MATKNVSRMTTLLAALAVVFSAMLAGGGACLAQSAELAQQLAAAQKTHPDILAAEAKVRLAEAELNQARMKVAREVLAAYWQLRDQEHVIRFHQAQLKKHGSEITAHELERAKAKLAELHAALDYALLKPAPASSVATRRAKTSDKPAPLKGEIAETVCALLGDPIQVEFIDTPISDIADYLADVHEIHFIVDVNDPLTEPDMPVTIQMKDVPLAAALQALEDTHPPLRFIIREYGILVTSKTSEAAQEGVSAVDYWKEHLQPKAKK